MLPTGRSGRTGMESRGDSCECHAEGGLERTQRKVEGGGSVDGGEVPGRKESVSWKEYNEWRLWFRGKYHFHTTPVRRISREGWKQEQEQETKIQHHHDTIIHRTTPSSNDKHTMPKTLNYRPRTALEICTHDLVFVIRTNLLIVLTKIRYRKRAC
ncbi:hypothetical protein EYC84_009247 [Monilinia fructicola]|uniref:Uncharacterized protein n=1 Tax=Monilinia fructicola TaxID=38448 RepID=A0A5M9JBJ7_MONFR|nr:hypothetical protein EYC84_009247 [Monilinia fructicola]